MNIKRVKNFSYNGFMGQLHDGYADWEIKSFVKWTNDPGIVEVIDTNDKTRLVPTFALEKDFIETLPEAPKLAPFEGKGDLFGKACKS